MKFFVIAIFLTVMNQSAYSLDSFKTGVNLSAKLGDTYCQNITHNSKSDWRMPSLNEMLELLSQGISFTASHCSNTKITNTLVSHKCLDTKGVVYNWLEHTSREILCVRGESTFSEAPASQNCPAASFSMTNGVLHIPLVNVPDLLGNTVKYDIDLKLVEDSLLFEFHNATKVE